MDGRAGQREIKCGPGVYGSLGPGAAAVTMNDAPDIGQTNAGAFKLVRTVEALEDAEQLVDVTHIKPDTVITDEESDFVSGGIGANFNSCHRAGPGIFEGVVDEVEEHLAKHIQVGVHLGEVANGPFD